MSKFRLRSYEISPPGGYPFEQREGVHRKFPSVPIIEDQARNVAAFRKANGLPRSTITEALSDVDCFQCQRLGNMPSYCVPTDQLNTPVAIGQTSPIINPCKGCGAPVG